MVVLEINTSDEGIHVILKSCKVFDRGWRFLRVESKVFWFLGGGRGVVKKMGFPSHALQETVSLIQQGFEVGLFTGDGDVLE